MPDLLGIIDREVHTKDTVTTRTSKVGGSLDWFDNQLVGKPHCGLCDAETTLIVQLYCPLDGSLYHRTLFVFACTMQSCWNNSKSWTVYRSQQLDTTSQEPSLPGVSAQHDAVVNDDWGMEADSWGVDADNWGNDAENNDNNADNGGVETEKWANGVNSADNWVNNDDNWGNAEQSEKTDQQMTADQHNLYPGEAKKISHTEADLNRSTDCCKGFSQECSEVPNSDQTVCGKDAESNEDVNLNNLALQQMCIDDVGGGISIDSDEGTVSHVISQEMPALSEAEREEAMVALQDKRTVVTSYTDLCAYFITVIEEPYHVEEADRHVTKLLKDYQKREGCNLKELFEDVSKGGAGGERYEKTSAQHTDAVFHKFMKKLAIYPQQIIRYEWSGQPMLIHSGPCDIPSRCKHCYGDLVFELQLLPGLVTKLKFLDHEGAAVEFGTVMIFTCRRSCWEQSDTFKTEQVVVQADPDQHLFK